MSFYGVIHRAAGLFITVNGGPDDRVDVVIDIDLQLSSTAHDYSDEDALAALFFDYTMYRLQFTHDNGSVVSASFLYYESGGEALDYVEDQRSHISSMNFARLVLSWDMILNDFPKAIDCAVKTTILTGKEKKEKHDEVCVICLEEFQEEDKIGTMVACKHSYHQDCIKKWSMRSTEGAICRTYAFDNFSS